MCQQQIPGFADSQTRMVKGLAFVVPVFAVLLSILLLAACGGHVNHKVVRGESLYSIGFYYGHDYRDIAKWNNIPPPYIITTGQWLRVAPPDDYWWDEERKIPAKQRFSKPPLSANNRYGKPPQPGQLNQAQQAQTKRQEPRHNLVGVAKNNASSGVSTKQIIVEDFTDKSGEISHWVWPTKGRLISPDKKFSPKKDKGIDIAGRRGQPIVATSAGKVVYSGSGLIGYGKLIIIKHNKTYLSAYAHNEKILVAEGDIVKRGQKIALMGRTPDNHIKLHFEIRRNGKPVNPLRFLKR